MPHFVAVSGSIQPGDRLVFDHALSREDDLLRGSLDNSVGVTACLLAALALCKMAPNVPVGFAFTDEEEGLSESASSFARGARRLVRRLNPPEICVNVDGHEVSEWCSLGDGAFFAEKASKCRGAIVTPHRYSFFKELAQDMTAHGIRITENRGNLSRSDDVAFLETTADILLLGYPVKDPHFNRAVPSASLSDILCLAKAVFWTATFLADSLPMNTHDVIGQN